MKKRELTRDEKLDRFHDYYGKAVIFIGLALLPAGVGGPIMLASFLGSPIAIGWQALGWLLVATAIGCVITAVGLSIRSSYWADRAKNDLPAGFSKRQDR